MTNRKFIENLAKEWVSFYGADKESLNNFANVYALSYEDYNAIWEVLDSMYGEA